MTFREMVSSIEDVIEEARNGRIFILVDDEERENEGDLVIPAQMATPEAINFMARHGRGLICLALTRERIEQLDLPLMAKHNESRHQTAFTLSIEARDGVTTGISAPDRAHTIAVAIDPSKGKSDIVTPGHVFPLVARDGGVLARTGHTEAVEIEFDPAVVSFEALLDVFWSCHDPTTLNRQGPDIGTQYRSAVFFHSPEQAAATKESKARLEAAGRYRNPIVTEIIPVSTFYRAEEYHQGYLEERNLL